MTAPASPPDLAVPTDPTAVDAAWMDLALRDVAAPDARVVGVEFAGYVGTGQMGRNARSLDGDMVRLNEESYCWTFRPKDTAYIEDEEEVEAGMTIPPLL